MRILPTDIKIFGANIKKKTALLIFVAVIALATNIVFVALRNESNHNLMLWCNVAIDVIAGWFVYAYYSFAIADNKKLLKLASSLSTVELIGTITEQSATSLRVNSLDCYTVNAMTNEGERTFYLADKGSIRLESGKVYTLRLANNIVILAEVRE